MNLSILRGIFAAMEQGVVFIDDRNRIVYCNPAAERIRNFRSEDVLHQSILDFHPPASHSKVLEIIKDLKTGKVPGHHRMNIQMREGKFFDNTYSAVWGPGNKYFGVIVVSQEVTQRKEAEDELRETLERLQIANDELKRLNQMKDNFFSNVSHELKTPMISVMGYVGMILKGKAGPLSERQQKFLEVSFRNLQKLEKNITALLDLAEIGIRKEDWVFRPVDLTKVVELSCSTVDLLAQGHEIQMVTNLPSREIRVLGDEDKLDQVFDNLLTNAVKYNREGGKIAVDLYADKEFAFVNITDTGVGISPAALKEVFTRHFQEGTQSLGNFKGLGIGLSLVQEIVHAHGGKVHLESEPRRGTTFTVMLPKTH
jgi:PAS domain S-box-containing protein